MTQKEKELLLKDLCARLPYGVKVQVEYDAEEFGKTVEIDEITMIDKYGEEILLYHASEYFSIEELKPYLRPMSSMTEEEKEELLNLLFDKKAKYFYIDKEGLIDSKTFNLMKEGLNYPAFCPINIEIYTDFLNAHHFDWRTDSNGRTLIEKGLALEAPEGMYK